MHLVHDGSAGSLLAQLTTLNAGTAQHLAVLLLGHTLAALLNNRTHCGSLTSFRWSILFCSRPAQLRERSVSPAVSLAYRGLGAIGTNGEYSSAFHALHKNCPNFSWGVCCGYGRNIGAPATKA